MNAAIGKPFLKVTNRHTVKKLTDRWTDGQMVRWTDRQVDSQTEGEMNRQTG